MSDTVIATEPLFIGRARAHNPGDEVPAEHVERYGWTGKVAPAESTAALQVQGVDVEEVVELKGDALDEALEKAGLPKGGSADQKRARLAAKADVDAAAQQPASEPEGPSAAN